MKSLKLPDGELFYEIEGTGDPLVMLHAGIADSRMWAAQVKHFAGQFQTVRCDLRGFGQSQLPNGPFSFEGDVLALVEALELAPTWLIGASFGGKVAIDFCLSYPQRIRGLILAAPAVGGFESGAAVDAFDEQEEALLEAGKLVEATELNMRMWVDGPHRTRDQVDADLRRQVAEMQLQAFSQPEPENVSLNKIDPPAIERLSEIQVPVLIANGGLDVPDFVELGASLANQINGAQRVVIPAAAHLVSMEAPAEFNRQVEAFIAAHS